MSKAFWQRMQRLLNEMTAAYPGVVGIHLRDLMTGTEVGVNSDEPFPTASIIKMPLLVKLMQMAEEGELDLDEMMYHDGAESVAGSGILHYLPDPVELTWRNIIIMMIALSDNTATNLCIERCGVGAVNSMLDDLDLTVTRLNRRMVDQPAAQGDHDNVSNPRELVTLLRLLHAGSPSARSAADALAILELPQNDLLSRAILDKNLRITNKPGYIPGAWCDAGIVHLPRRPYAIALMTKYDQTLDRGPALAILRAVHAEFDLLDRSNAIGHAVYGRVLT